MGERRGTGNLGGGRWRRGGVRGATPGLEARRGTTVVVSTSPIECGSDPSPRAWSGNRFLVQRQNCTGTLNIFYWAAPQHGPQQRGIDWRVAVHASDTRQAIPTLIARYYSFPEWHLMGDDADHFNPFWTLEKAYNVEVFYCVWVPSAYWHQIPTTVAQAPDKRLGAGSVGRAPDRPCQRAHEVNVTRSGGEPKAHAPSGIRSREVAPRCVSDVQAPSG